MGFTPRLSAFVHAMLAEYLSFIVLLFALYTVAGGILVTGNVRGTPATNTAILALGTGMASIVGTTGAAMILIRPLSRRTPGGSASACRRVLHHPGRQCRRRADAARRPAALRRLPARRRFLLARSASVAADGHRGGAVLTAFVVVDASCTGAKPARPVAADVAPIRIRVLGGINFVLIGLIIMAILCRAPGGRASCSTSSARMLELQNIVRDAALVAIALLSLWLTPGEQREENGFTWEPIREVAILFAAIFIAIIR